MKMKRVFGLMTAAGCALYAVSAKGDEPAVSQDFESISGQIADQTGWTGYGTVTASEYTAAVSGIGTPISSAAKTKVLAVEGRVTCSNTTMTASKPTTVDMMVQIALPDDGLAFPSNVTTEDIQIAVGVDTNATDATKGDLKVYCANKAGVADWYSLGKTLDKDTWHRVSFTFDYANATKLCQIRLDGDPLMTANGYLTTDTSKLSDQPGSWYKLATSGTKLVSVQVIGSTSIDELLVQQNTAADATVNDVLPVIADAGGTTAAASTGVAVENAWIERQGITRAAVTADNVAPDSSGMKISEKYRTGLSVTDGQKFEISAMSMKDEGGKRYATLTLPSTGTVPSGYTNKVQYKTASGNWTDASVTASGTVNIEIPSSGDLSDPVIYVRLVNE